MERAVHDLIESVVRRRFADASIEAVNITEDTDFDGDAVFRVTVVFNSKGPLDSHKTTGIVRHLRHQLLERDESRFPVLTFLSKADAARLSPEAA